METDFPGQLIEYSAYGHAFKYGPGAKGGDVYAEDGRHLGKFARVEVSEEGTPCGTYVGRTDADMIYADTIDGASAVLHSLTHSSEQTSQLAYALWYTLFSHVEQITDMRRTLNSDEGKDAPGAIRASAERAVAELEARYARLVREYAQMPEALRPDMRDRRLILPEGAEQ